MCITEDKSGSKVERKKKVKELGSNKMIKISVNDVKTTE